MTNTSDEKRPASPEPERQQLERDWADVIQRALRKGPMPPDADPKPATKKDRRAK